MTQKSAQLLIFLLTLALAAVAVILAGKSGVNFNLAPKSQTARP